jgi:hypothetical protein
MLSASKLHAPFFSAWPLGILFTAYWFLGILPDQIFHHPEPGLVRGGDTFYSRFFEGQTGGRPSKKRLWRKELINSFITAACF